MPGFVCDRVQLDGNDHATGQGTDDNSVNVFLDLLDRSCTSGEHQVPSLTDIQESEPSSHADSLSRSSASNPMLTHGSSHSIQQPLLNLLSTQASLTTAILSPQQTVNAVPPQNVQQQQPQPSQRQGLKKKTKRPRNALQLQERLEINVFCEKNQHMSTYNISKKLNVPRTTIYGVIKDKDRLKELTASGASRGLTPARKSSVEAPFRIVEELLVTWSLDLRDRGFVVTDEKITAQAFEIHKMLFGIVSKPLLPCKFTAGWLKNFKKRRSEAMLAISSTVHQADDWSLPEDLLRRLPTGLDDVFMCGMVSMYLDVLPTRVYATSSQESETTIQDSPIASVLLCCNATGTSLRAPYVS
ncbi:MAG: hypothetical protein J3Q66DRAFT_444048, partial [Benniella sp.]